MEEKLGNSFLSYDSDDLIMDLEYPNRLTYNWKVGIPYIVTGIAIYPIGEKYRHKITLSQIKPPLETHSHKPTQ